MNPLKKLSFRDVVKRLDEFWSRQGCIIVEPIDTEVGAGTFHPATFFKALGKEPWRVAYVQPSCRPTDGRYADNPLRLQRYYQYQVIIKPPSKDIKEIYLKSLRAIGIDLQSHDVRFVEDDWESPTLGASGLGWEVWLDSMEVTQFTYFQQVGGIGLDKVSCEITYGLERTCMFIQKRLDLFKLKWQNKITYGELHREQEIEFSKYNFEYSDITLYKYLFESFEKEAVKLLGLGLLYPAYSFVLKASHAFNILDARGAISQTERPTYIARVRALAKRCAEIYLSRPAIVRKKRRTDEAISNDGIASALTQNVKASQ